MTQVTEDSSVQIRNPVANRADFDSHKFKGTFGWATDQVAPVFCPDDDADFVRLSVHPDEAPDAGTLNPGDTILISVGGVLKRTTVTAIGGGGTWQPLDQDLTDIAALTTQAFGRSLLTQANAGAVRTLIGAPAVADLAGYQPLDSDLTAISGLATDAFGRSLLTQTSAANVRSLIGAGTSSFSGAYTSLSAIPAAIDALDALTPAADRLPYFTNGTTAALATFSAFARTLLDDADAATARATLGAGTVSSVALTMPTGFSVANSPVTGSGTLAVTLASQTADKVLASPSGASGVPAFITLSASHIPNLPWAKITSGLPTTLAGYGITDAQPVDADLTAIAALSTTGFLQRTGANTWTLVAAPTPAAHEASHRAGGSDQLNLTNIFGGRITDVPQFAGLTLTGDTVVNQDTSWAANSTDGNDQSALSFCGGRTASATRGSFVTVRGNERATSGGTLTLAAGDGIQGNIEFATATIVRGTWKKDGELHVSSGAFRVGSTFTGLIAATGGLFRQATNADLPGPLNTLSQLANGNGVLRNTGAGTLSWEVAIPGESYTSLGFTAFGITTPISVYAYQIKANNGIGFGDSRGLNWRGGLVNSNEQWGFSQDAGTTASFKPFVIADGSGAVWYKHDANDASYKHYFTGNTRFSAAVNIIGAIQQNGADAITSTREGRLTGLRLSNLSSGQMPVASDSNGQITASGQTDDGTYFSTNRVYRAWNTLTKSGNTWTALQWNQSTEERVSIFSSDASGIGGYHSMVLVPWDADTADRGLGNIDWAQRVSGKSGTNPGLKIAMSGRSAGAGGSVGGYGGQWRLEYRPDNGANLVNALRVGVFGGSTADAVQADILLRASAGLQVSSSLQASFLTTGLVKSGATGLLSNATANTDYLPVANPASTGILTVDKVQARSSTISNSTPTLLSSKNQFVKLTYAGAVNLILPIPGDDIAGIVWKIQCMGCTSVVFQIDSPGTMYYLNNAGGSSNYWYQEASSSHTFVTNANENKSADIWCDGVNWYIRW